MRSKSLRSHGFTLLEIMVVLLIIGIAAGFAVLAFGDFGQSRRVLFAAEQFANTLKIAQEQALLTVSTLGVTIDDSGYQVWVFQQNKWMHPAANVLSRRYDFPKHTEVRIKTPLQSGAQTPKIILYGTGDMTPFTLHFVLEKEVVTTLEGKQNGSLSFKK